MTIDRPGSDSGETVKVDDSNETGDPATLSEMLGILSRRPKRRILFTLLHEDGAVSVESLAEAVAARDFSPAADGEERSDAEAPGS